MKIEMIPITFRAVTYQITDHISFHFMVNHQNTDQTFHKNIFISQKYQLVKYFPILFGTFKSSQGCFPDYLP